MAKYLCQKCSVRFKVEPQSIRYWRTDERTDRRQQCQ